MRHLAGVLRDIASAKDVAAGEGRIKPLIALNTIGVGGGGFDKVRGEVIDAMLTVCDDFVSRHDLDLVICCASASDYAAFQHQRRSHNSFPTLDADLREHGQRLAELARSGELALFLGAGVSMPAGLPSWWTLLVRLGERCGVTEAELLSLDSPLDQAELLDKRLAADGTDLTSAVKREFAGVSVPSLSHVQLAVLGCREVVTTNFDLLYDAALLTRDERLVAGQASAALREIRSLAENAGPASGWRQLQICWKDSGQRLPARRLLERPSVQEVAQAATKHQRPNLEDAQIWAFRDTSDTTRFSDSGEIARVLVGESFDRVPGLLSQRRRRFGRRLPGHVLYAAQQRLVLLVQPSPSQDTITW